MPQAHVLCTVGDIKKSLPIPMLRHPPRSVSIGVLLPVRFNEIGNKM